MASVEMLNSVGFEKSKIGSGDKEVGYKIKESTLGSLVGSIFLCFLVMCGLVVVMVYDVKLEKKTLHREVRQVEHHAATKLAHVQMELWSQYRDDVQESREASILLKHLEASYGEFQGRFQTAVNELAQELNLPQERSAKFADRILHLVTDMQQDNIKHAKHLLDHLVNSGKKGKQLEKHVDKEILKNAEGEKQKIADEGLPEEPEDVPEGEKDPLKDILKGFWFTFADYDKEMGTKVRENFKKGGPVYDQIKALQSKLTSETPPSEEEIGLELDKIDLASVGAPLGEGRILPPADIVEELFLIPQVPFEKLRDLKKQYESGKKDTLSVFSQLEEWHEKNLIPSGWLQMGVNEEEKQEDKEETEESD